MTVDSTATHREIYWAAVYLTDINISYCTYFVLLGLAGCSVSEMYWAAETCYLRFGIKIQKEVCLLRRSGNIQDRHWAAGYLTDMNISNCTYFVLLSLSVAWKLSRGSHEIS